MDASHPKIRRLRATPMNVPLARPHPTASGAVNPCGPSNRKRPWSFWARTSGATASCWIKGCKASMRSATGLRAIGRVQLLEEEALGWVEEPTRADDFAGHARIAAECRTPIQIGENLWGPDELTKSLSAGASDFVMLDVMKIGGITGWLRAVSQAQAAGLPVSSHLFPELSAQLLAISPHAHWLEYQDWAAPILERPLELKDGFALPQKHAGLGLTWDKDAVERYRVC